MTSTTVAISAITEGGASSVSTHSIPLRQEDEAESKTATATILDASSLSSKLDFSVESQQQQHQQQRQQQESVMSDDTKENNSTTTPSTPPGAVRKRLGCRRAEDDMITSSDEEGDDDEEDAVVRRKLFFTSPRLMEPDESLFPVNHSPYKNSQQRWQLVSEQAGSHRQEGTVLMIGRKITPMALRIGMTKQAAKRVRCLNLWLDHDKDILPEWLDVIASVFANLEHLTLTEDVFPGEDEMAVSARMRRLYVLYRLPYLKSIDDMVVTDEERRIARPNETDPNGDRVVRKALSSLLDDDDDTQSYSDAQDENHVDNMQLQQRHQQPSHYQQHLAHEMPVEIIHDKFSHGVLDDCVYGDENDGLGQIPRIPATLSNISARTAKEVGVEINQELAAKFAELNRTATATTATTTSETTGLDLDDYLDEKLAGEAMLSDLAASSEELGGPECQFSESLSQSLSDGEENDENVAGAIVSTGSQETSSTHHGDAVEVDLSGRIKQRIISSPGCSIDVLAEVGVDKRVKGVWSQVLDTTENSIELVSVASTDLEWTAACGVLSFRSDRSCAPRLRMPFSRNRNVIAADAAVAAIRQAKANLRNKQREKGADPRKRCTPVARNDTVETPQVGCCTFGSSQGKFFPDRRSSQSNPTIESSPVISANKQLPPSKSLSSPFPMQFRERKKTPPKTHLVVTTSESTDSGKGRPSLDDSNKETISSPLQAINSVSSSSPRSREQKKLRAGKGDLPPPCPTASRRKVPVAPIRARKSKRRHRNLKASKENARSTSVMDLEEEEEDDDDEEDDADAISQTSSLSTDSNDDRDSLAYSEAS